jgi:hypothetical protein
VVLSVGGSSPPVVLMSNKKPMKFLPPDDPTAVYPIRTVKLDEELEPAPEAPPELEPAEMDEGLGLDGHPDLTSPKNGSGGPNPLVLLAFLAGGMILAAGVLAAVALLVFAIQ